MAGLARVKITSHRSFCSTFEIEPVFETFPSLPHIVEHVDAAFTGILKFFLVELLIFFLLFPESNDKLLLLIDS